MNEPLFPESISEIEQLISDNKCVLPVGNRTKKPLSNCPAATLVSLSRYSGVTEYEPSEFTFTAKAGTRVSEVQRMLSENRQYLPFDPLLAGSGATLGGTVAANASGPGRFRFGGIRDFILGVRFLSGDGKTIQAGGKVVKNAAGFDIPKLLVGSMGRLGAITELTFKVFPKPESTLSLWMQCPDHIDAIKRISSLAKSSWELDAIEYQPRRQAILVRICGQNAANEDTAKRIESKWPDQVTQLRDELSWYLKPDQLAIKVATTRQQFLDLQGHCDASDVRSHLSVAGAVTWLHPSSESQVDTLDDVLTEQKVCGLVVTGDSNKTWVGLRVSSDMETGIKNAMDPIGKFPSLT